MSEENPSETITTRSGSVLQQNPAYLLTLQPHPSASPDNRLSQEEPAYLTVSDQDNGSIYTVISDAYEPSNPVPPLAETQGCPPFLLAPPTSMATGHTPLPDNGDVQYERIPGESILVQVSNSKKQLYSRTSIIRTPLSTPPL